MALTLGDVVLWALVGLGVAVISSILTLGLMVVVTIARAARRRV